MSGELGLWEHQKIAIQRALECGSFGLFFDPGTGKTRTTIEILRHLFTAHGDILKTVIICPGVVCHNWKNEFLKFSKVPAKEIEILEGSGKRRLETVLTTNARILVMNYQTLLMIDVFRALKDFGPMVVIADESHRLKNPKASTTKRAIELGAQAKYRYILTGTPILQNSMDIFSQFEFLDMGRTFGRNFFTFRRKYFTDMNAALRARSVAVTWAKWVPIKSKEPEITEKVSRISMSVAKEDCLDLPPLVRQRLEVSMSPAQQKAYDEMKRHMITFIKDEACTAQMALHKALRLQQIVSGFIGNDDGEEHTFKEVPRLTALKELLGDLCESNKVIVWACWRNNQNAIRGILDDSGIEYRTILGDSGPGEREQAMRDFRDSDSVRVLLGSQGAGGIGVNLVEASYSVYYSRSFSLEHDIQSEARNHRGGSEIHEKITRIDLVTPGSIDDDVLEALTNKMEISERIIFKCLS